MDKTLEEKIKTQAKEYCKNPSFKGSIPDDRLAPIKEAMYFSGAEAMWELIKELHPVVDDMIRAMLSPIGPATGKEFPEKDFALMKDPLSGITPLSDLVDDFMETKAFNDAVIKQGSPMKGATLTGNVPVEFKPSSIATGLNIPTVKAIPEEHWIGPTFNDKGEEIIAPNPKPEKKAPASKNKKK